MTQHFIPAGLLKESSKVFLRIEAGAIVSEVGSLIELGDGTFEISMQVLPMSGSALEFDLPDAAAAPGRRSLEAVLDGRHQTARVEIGEVIIAGGKGQAKFYAHAGLDVRYVF